MKRGKAERNLNVLSVRYQMVRDYEVVGFSLSKVELEVYLKDGTYWRDFS